MESYSRALSLILGEAAGLKLGPEPVHLMDACDRFVASDLHSPLSLPTFPSSAMDGFAVHAQAFAEASPENPLKAKVLGTIVAGDLPEADPRQNGVWEIMTGAPFPKGFDATVKVEDVQIEKDGEGRSLTIQLRSAPRAEQHVRRVGEDLNKGDLLIRQGTRVTPEHILLLGSVGLTSIPVFRKARVGIIATGRELVSIDEEPGPGQLRNSTAPYLLTALRQRGVDAKFLGLVPDAPEEFEKLLGRATAEAFDLVITTGAVSMGTHDFVKGSLLKLSAEILFHKVAIRPGKPLLLAKIPKGPLVFGMPGNPISTVVALRFFVDPYLRKIHQAAAETLLSAQLSNDVTKPEGLRCFMKAQVKLTPEGFTLQASAKQMSSMVAPLGDMSAWAVIPEEGSKFFSGTPVHFLPLEPMYNFNGDHNDRNP